MFLLDTANLSDIERALAIFPIQGVTTNPSILKKEGKIDFFAHLRAIRGLIGPKRSLHVQVVAQEAEQMLAEAEAIRREVGAEVYIKVPVTPEGLKAIQILKAKGCRITATAIYSELQAYLAIEAGADYLAPYVNRMENLGVSAQEVISHIRQLLDRTGASSQILGASYKNGQQITASLVAGAHAVTVQPSLLEEAVWTAPIQKAVTDFAKDWQETFEQTSFAD